jgi:hypothetical protein
LSPHALAGEWLARSPERPATEDLGIGDDERAVGSVRYQALTAEMLNRGLLIPQDEGPPTLAFVPPFTVRSTFYRVLGLTIWPLWALAGVVGGVAILQMNHTIGYRLLAVALFALSPVLVWVAIRTASTGLSVDENGIRVSGFFAGHLVRWSELVDITYLEKHDENGTSTGWVYVLVTTDGSIRPEVPQEGDIGWDSKMANLRLVLLAMRDVARTWPSTAPGTSAEPSDMS